MQNKLFFILFFSSYVAHSSLGAGDIVSVGMPLSGAAASLFLKDYQGVLQLALATGVVQGTTEVLKQVVNERRPNGHCCSSFPSGHTSLAFTGASFVHFRYGFKYSIPLYIGSMYVAYNRVQIKAHHIYDVAFGAGLAVAGTYLSTTKYKLDGVSIAVSGGYAGIIYRKVFD